MIWPNWEKLDLSELYDHVKYMHERLLKSLNQEARITAVMLAMRAVLDNLSPRMPDPINITRCYADLHRVLEPLASRYMWARVLLSDLPQIEARTMRSVSARDTRSSVGELDELIESFNRMKHWLSYEITTLWQYEEERGVLLFEESKAIQTVIDALRVVIVSLPHKVVNPISVAQSYMNVRRMLVPMIPYYSWAGEIVIKLPIFEVRATRAVIRNNIAPAIADIKDLIGIVDREIALFHEYMSEIDREYSKADRQLRKMITLMLVGVQKKEEAARAQRELDLVRMLIHKARFG